MPFLYFITAPILRNQSERALKHWTLPNPKGFDLKQKYSVPSVYLAATSAPIRDGYYNVNLNGSETIASNAGSVIDNLQSRDTRNIFPLAKPVSEKHSAIAWPKNRLPASTVPSDQTTARTPQSISTYKFRLNFTPDKAAPSRAFFASNESAPTRTEGPTTKTVAAPHASSDHSSDQNQLRQIIANIYQPKTVPTTTITTKPEPASNSNGNNAVPLSTITAASPNVMFNDRFGTQNLFQKWQITVIFKIIPANIETAPSEQLNIQGQYSYSVRNDPLALRVVTISRTSARSLTFSAYWPAIGNGTGGLIDPLFGYKLTVFDSQQRNMGNLSAIERPLSKWRNENYPNIPHDGNIAAGYFRLSREVGKVNDINHVNVTISFRSYAERLFFRYAWWWLVNNYAYFYTKNEFDQISSDLIAGDFNNRFSEVRSLYQNIFKNSVVTATSAGIIGTSLNVITLRIAPTLKDFFIAAGDRYGNPRAGTFLSFKNNQFNNDPERQFYGERRRQENGNWIVVLVVPENIPILLMSRAGDKVVNTVGVIYSGPRAPVVHARGVFAAQQVRPHIISTINHGQLTPLYGKLVPYLGTPDEARRNFPFFYATAAAGALFLGTSAHAAAANGLATWLSNVAKNILKELLKQATEGVTRYKPFLWPQRLASILKREKYNQTSCELEIGSKSIMQYCQ